MSFTEKELTIFAVVLFFFMSTITGYKKITKSILLSFNIDNRTNLLILNSILFGFVFYFGVGNILEPVYDKYSKDS
tara:strand:- start:8603 stop:8830 length:228 start_codon:yes stop_codon:yes gene_type:complete